MASDLTQPKRFAFVSQAGSPSATLPCPTCEEPMAVDMLHALHALDMGAFASARDLRWCEASHTVPASDGGKRVALECNRCNRARGSAAWSTDTPTYSVGKRARYREANGIVVASREQLATLGYTDR